MPGPQVPENGGDQQREHHGETGPGAHLENQLDRQQGDDSECDCPGCKHDADKVPHAGPGHGEMRRHGMRIDDGRDSVRRVMKPVDEFEAERDQQGKPEQDKRPD